MGYHPPNLSGKGLNKQGAKLKKDKTKNRQSVKLPNLIHVKPVNIRKQRQMERRARFAKDDAERALLRAGVSHGDMAEIVAGPGAMELDGTGGRASKRKAPPAASGAGGGK